MTDSAADEAANKALVQQATATPIDL